MAKLYIPTVRPEQKTRTRIFSRCSIYTNTISGSDGLYTDNYHHAAVVLEHHFDGKEDIFNKSSRVLKASACPA